MPRLPQNNMPSSRRHAYGAAPRSDLRLGCHWRLARQCETLDRQRQTICPFHPQNEPRRSARLRRKSAFTLVELLVVMAIIAILFGAIFVATSSVLVRAKVNSTQAVLHVVADALEEFKREQQANPTIARASRTGTQTNSGNSYGYRDRYGEYPPDELEVFTALGLPDWKPSTGLQSSSLSLAPGRAEIAPSQFTPSPTWGSMRFYADGDLNATALEHRDIAAMVLAIDLLGDASKAILDKIPGRNWQSAPLDENGTDPVIWLDRPRRPGDKPDGQWGSEDVELRYIVDAWGTPLSYFSQRDWSTKATPIVSGARVSSNHPLWNEASSAFVRFNGGVPLIMSYGPDGEDQLKKDAMSTLPTGEADGNDALASLVGDFAAYPDSSIDRKINHPLNEDNVYINPELRDKLAQGP